MDKKDLRQLVQNAFASKSLDIIEFIYQQPNQAKIRALSLKKYHVEKIQKIVDLLDFNKDKKLDLKDIDFLVNNLFSQEVIVSLFKLLASLISMRTIFQSSEEFKAVSYEIFFIVIIFQLKTHLSEEASFQMVDVVNDALSKFKSLAEFLQEVGQFINTHFCFCCDKDKNKPEIQTALYKRNKALLRKRIEKTLRQKEIFRQKLSIKIHPSA